MSVTILGQHIRWIRPAKIKMPIILKKDRPKCKYNKKPITIELSEEQESRIGSKVVQKLNSLEGELK